MSESLELVVDHLDRVADNVLAVTLVDPDGGELPGWKPGAHVEVVLGGHIRHYSLCGSPTDRYLYRLGILRQPGGRGGSEYAHTALTVGQRLTVGEPRNQFPLVKGSAYLFLAGGIGITPFLPMIEQVHRDELPWRLIYGGRTLTSMAFRTELERYGHAVTLWPQDVHGHPDIESAMAVPPGTRVYACGPEPLLAAVLARAKDLDGSSVHIERFAPRVDLSAGPMPPFELYCSDSDVTIQVGANESMLDALLRSGIDMSYDCRQGTCGSCELEIIEGSALHRDSVLEPDDPDRKSRVFPCVSRADAERLVVDI